MNAGFAKSLLGRSDTAASSGNQPGPFERSPEDALDALSGQASREICAKKINGRSFFWRRYVEAGVQGARAQDLAAGATRRRRDPRDFQISTLLLLLIYGSFQLNFEVPLFRIFAILNTALLVQFLCGCLVSRRLLFGIPPSNLRAFEPRSALISGLSLCLLLRTNSLLLAAAAAAIAIASKFLLRWQGKHVFNPTNFALVVMLLCCGGNVWVSPGQWGSVAFFAFALVCVGGLVVNRAARADVTLAFLCFYLAILFGRSAWLGEPIAIPWHRLQNGALLIFAFFMISDPKTTPDARAGRVLFALLVALGAGYVQFKLFRANGLLWSLAACSLAVPLIDYLLPGQRYQWRKPPAAPISKINYSPMKGDVYEPIAV